MMINKGRAYPDSRLQEQERITMRFIERLHKAEEENGRLRAALDEISTAAGANHCGVLARAALRGEGEK